ncbi:TPA: LlaJI family restriction endonuclease, partial [Streptococcus pyogenes]|nr:LlaJI family restriction endonuclease [Streptococcus pyogenes]
MYIATMQELKPYSFFDLQNEFHMSEEELKNILKSLSLMNIVKKLSKDVSKVELEELLETDSLEKLNTELEGNMYVFKYVGMLVIGNVCLLIYPKYAVSYLNDSINNFQKLKQLISVIRKYQSKEQKIGFSSQVDVDNFNLLSIALELIYSYYDHGLYSNDKQIIEQNGCGEILWEKTINESTAYFSNGLPIYLDTFTVNQENNEQDYFRRLHAFILSEVCKKLKDILRILDID